jgi:hypothetical protein
MDYMLLIVEPKGQRAERSSDEGRAAYDQMLGFAAELESRGVLRGYGSLRAENHGVRVEVRDGTRRTVDGPFSEAKEMVGGYFLVDCETRDDAVAIAASCPAAGWAAVEVRPMGPCWD